MNLPEELHSLSATEALRLFHSREVSPVELTEAVIARAEATEPSINAFSYRMFEDALENAQAAEARYLGHGAKPRPLEGLTVAIKDSGHIRDMPTSAASLTSSEAPQKETSLVNERVLKAGAIVHARTTTPEFSCAAVTHSRKWGVTRNPWNFGYTPGGSSGGAGAALAAGSTMLATGSDIAGSIRIPASCCGVVGLKPSRGRNPVDAPFNLDTYCHTGPLARTVGDAMLLQNVLCGPDPTDPTLLSPKLTLKFNKSDLKDLKIAWSLDLGFYEVDQAVIENTRSALATLSDLGAHLVEIDLPWDWQLNTTVMTHLSTNFASSIAPMLNTEADSLTSYARQFAQSASDISAHDLRKASMNTARIGEAFCSLMEEFDFFVCPTTAIPAVPASFDHSRDELSINGKVVPAMLGWVMTPVFNMLCTHPVISLPSGHSSDGVPTGVQFVGRPYADQELISAALNYENARPDIFGCIAEISKNKRPEKHAIFDKHKTQTISAVLGQTIEVAKPGVDIV
ncbi:MAG: amidase [Pseudomonadota bacterium]